MLSQQFVAVPHPEIINNELVVTCSTPNGDTIYRIGSLTKVITVVALMQLRDAGKVVLDDPVNVHSSPTILSPKIVEDHFFFRFDVIYIIVLSANTVCRNTFQNSRFARCTATTRESLSARSHRNPA